MAAVAEGGGQVPLAHVVGDTFGVEVETDGSDALVLDERTDVGAAWSVAGSWLLGSSWLAIRGFYALTCCLRGGAVGAWVSSGGRTTREAWREMDDTKGRSRAVGEVTEFPLVLVGHRVTLLVDYVYEDHDGRWKRWKLPSCTVLSPHPSGGASHRRDLDDVGRAASPRPERSVHHVVSGRHHGQDEPRR